MEHNGHLKDVTEAGDRGEAQESVGVTLAETHSSEDMETEEATFCSQAGSIVE